jgi:hypothetical protein
MVQRRLASPPTNLARGQILYSLRQNCTLLESCEELENKTYNVHFTRASDGRHYKLHAIPSNYKESM